MKKSSKNVEAPVSEVDEPTPSRSTRKRKGPELSSNVKKGKKNPRVLEDPVDVPPSTRSTRSSPKNTMITIKDTGGKKSTSKLSDKKNGSGKKTKDTSKASQKDTSNLGAPKKLDLNVSTVKTSMKSTPSKVAKANTRGKLKAEEEKKRRRRR